MAKTSAGWQHLSRLVLVILLTVALLALALMLGAPFVATGSYLPVRPLPWWVFAISFAATEAVVLHIQVRREAQTVSLSEFPLVLGLFLASPTSLVLGRILGSAVIFVLHRRSPPLKSLFNTALVAAESCVALSVFSAVTTAAGTSDPASWLAAYAAALTANALGAVAIGTAISLHEGGFDARTLVRDAVLGQPAAPMVVTLGLVAATNLAVDVHNAWLLAGSGAVLLISYRAYAALSDRHLSLERLYRFSQAVTSSPEIDEVMRSVLTEAREMLRAERAELLFISEGADGVTEVARVRLRPSGRLTRQEGAVTPADAWLLQAAVTDVTAVLMTRAPKEDEPRRWLEAHGLREAIAAPVRGAAGTVGVLIVGDRCGDVRTYDWDDVLLLETVANHAGVALQNGQLVDRLRHDAHHDALTGLPNRVYLQRELDNALADVRGGRSRGVGIMILDLDGFKDVNDTLGHHQGDLLLVKVGERIQRAVGDEGEVARLGGDEFAVLLAGTDDPDEVARVGERIIQAMEHPVALDDLEVEVGASLGASVAPVHGLDAGQLLKQADTAMYDAKASGRSLRLYESGLDTHTLRRLSLVPELRAALADGGIEVHVQPKLAVATGDVVGVEALVRWSHPDFGWVPPDEFIPVAERSGLIGPLTTTVLDASLEAWERWRDAGHDLTVAVNLSTRSLLDPGLVDEVRQALRRHGAPGCALTLEITEGSVMADPDRAVALLHELRELGVLLSVDDFGTGYSSLSYLKRLPVHEVKIDRSFVIGLREGDEGVAIVRSIIDLGHHLGLNVVAEGVEDQHTLDLLAAMRCDLAQGWHIARPMPVPTLLPWLASALHCAAPRPLTTV